MRAMTSGILSGMRVVEASAFVAAPLGGMTLAQMGADVIRIDLPGGGLDYRRWPVSHDDVSLFWCGLNKAKRSVCIDFTKPGGREIAMALITARGEEAGMLLTNFPPRGWLSYESLRARRADLIQLTVQGDHLGRSAVDYTVNAATGLPYMTGPSTIQEPINHVLPAWDLITGHMAATGLLAAERHRRRTGEGQHIKLALEDVALASMGNLGFIAEAQLGHQRQRFGNYLYGAFGGDFVCADGERVMVVGLTLKQWQSLCAALILDEEMAMLQRRLGLDFSLEGDRFRAREEIAASVRTRIGAHQLGEISTLFDQHGVCWSRYQTVHELVAHDPACSERNPLFRMLEQPGVGRLLVPTIPLDFGYGGRRAPAAAPRLGDHTDEVLGDVLGLDDAAIGRLHDQGVIAGSAIA
jgi:2-methylfumaryl-CoA isomerase